MSDTLVFIPAWNEEDSLPAVPLGAPARPRLRGGADASGVDRSHATVVADGDARTTAGNAQAVAAAAREAGATDVVVVTSWWHRPRASALLRAALGKDVRLQVVAARRPSPPHVLLRELACMVALPLQLLSNRRARS